MNIRTVPNSWIEREHWEKDSRREIHTMVAVAAGARSSQTARSHQKARGSSAPLNSFSQNVNGAAPATGGKTKNLLNSTLKFVWTEYEQIRATLDTNMMRQIGQQKQIALKKNLPLFRIASLQMAVSRGHIIGETKIDVPLCVKGSYTTMMR